MNGIKSNTSMLHIAHFLSVYCLIVAFYSLCESPSLYFFQPLRVSLISSGIQPCKRRARRPGYSWQWCCSWTCRHPTGCPVPPPSFQTPRDPCHHDRDLRDPAGTSGPLCYPFLLCHLSCKSHMINHWMTICTSSMESIKIVNMNKSLNECDYST